MADNEPVYYQVINISDRTLQTKFYNIDVGSSGRYDICNSTSCCKYVKDYKVYTMEQILKILVFK